MKKLIIPVLAIVLAFSSSAFTTNKTVKGFQPALFWYSLDASGHLQAQLNTVAQTKDDSMLGGANQITPCDDSTTDVCIVGYASTQTLNIPAPPASGDARINKDQ